MPPTHILTRPNAAGAQYQKLPQELTYGGQLINLDAILLCTSGINLRSSPIIQL